MLSGVTKVAHITTKQDMSRWTRAHADEPGITWSVFPGPGGTMIIVEHAEDRCTFNRANAPARTAGAMTAGAMTAGARTADATGTAPAGSAGVDRASA